MAFAWLALASLQGILPSILTWSSPFAIVVEGRTVASRSPLLPSRPRVWGARRGLRDQDAVSSAVIVDLDLARSLWGDDYLLGQRFRLSDEGEWHTVVGVVRENQFFGRDERNREYQVLVPADPVDPPMQTNLPITDIYVRARGDAAPS